MNLLRQIMVKSYVNISSESRDPDDRLRILVGTCDAYDLNRIAEVAFVIEFTVMEECLVFFGGEHIARSKEIRIRHICPSASPGGE